MMNLLQTIASREDLLRLDDKQIQSLCEEIRAFLIENVSHTGGHLASNLGVVELTVAIHKVFDCTTDRLVFDVGHQSYVHKLLTGRMEGFSGLRQFGGMAGFPKPSESCADAFIAGHASDSVSVALGMARARTLSGADYQVLALMGDGAMTGGLAYEGLNDAGESTEPLIVILNDNGMSITPNVGGIARHLSNIRIRPSYYRIKRVWRSMTRTTKTGQFFYRHVHRVKEWAKRKLIGSNMFNDMGFEYIGPIDGHDVGKLTYLLQIAAEMRRPVLLHVITRKGKGYPPAEENPDLFHGIGRFNSSSGEIPHSSKPTFSATFGDTMCRMAEENPKICAITAAMRSGTGLQQFGSRFPDRFFDVGIAEGHAVCMAAGLAKQGMIPVVAIYSTFLQRAYDMLLHDVGILGLHVVFAVDRAGLVGHDGETHHGTFDVCYLRSVPGMQILCPSNQAELKQMLRHAVLEMTGPVAVRFPRGGDGRFTEAAGSPVLRQGDALTLCAYGTMINPVLDAADVLEQQGYSTEVIKLPSVSELPPALYASARKTGRLLLAEETLRHGGIFDWVSSELEREGVRTLGLDLGDRYVSHGSNEELLRQAGLTGPQIAARAIQWIQRQE